MPCMYLDILGLVTTGVGNLIDPMPAALTLPWQRFSADGPVPATKQEITDEWARVKAEYAQRKSNVNFWSQGAKLSLSNQAVNDLLLHKADQNDAELTKRFPDFQSWPADAQLATHSMTWAMGSAFNFPMWEKAVRAGDWKTAAQECEARDHHLDPQGKVVVDNPGLVPRNAANKALFTSAAVRVRARASLDTCSWTPAA